MGEHESRLHAMLNDNGMTWDLNDADRAAIRWLIDYAAKLQGELSESRRQERLQFDRNAEMRKAAERASADFMRVAVTR